MRLFEFEKEINDKTAVFTFGRFQPPHVGHAMLIDKIKNTAKSHNADPYIFVSQSHDNKKNPLDYKTKMHFLKEFFPGANIIDDPEKIHSLFDTLYYLADLGYDHLIMVAGSDRISHYKNMVDKYIPSITPDVHPDKAVNIKTFTVLDAGARNEDDMGVQGASATKAREFAIGDDLESFLKIAPEGNINTQTDLYHAVRKGVNM